MEDNTSFELFYDVLDESIQVLYEINHRDFFTLLIDTCRNIVSQDVLDSEASNEQQRRLMDIYHKLEDHDFSVEDIRKAFQMMVLRAFNECNLKKGDVTPDTLGLLFAYLMKKLNKSEEKLKILDPVVGSGNLLYSTSNHLSNDLQLFGIDHAKVMSDLAAVLGDLLNYDIEIYCQDCLDHSFSDMDFVVADLPDETVEAYENRYFPYLCVLQHLASLKANGYFLAIVPNDFFEHDEDGFFKENLKNVGSVLGVLQLPTEFFVAHPKSIVIFSKEALESKKCLLVELPSFKDEAKFSQALMQIEQWFDQREKERG